MGQLQEKEERLILPRLKTGVIRHILIIFRKSLAFPEELWYFVNK